MFFYYFHAVFEIDFIPVRLNNFLNDIETSYEFNMQVPFVSSCHSLYGDKN